MAASYAKLTFLSTMPYLEIANASFYLKILSTYNN